MSPSLRWRVPLVLAAVALAAYFAFPLRERISLGLDLQGGMHLVLKVDTANLPPEAQHRDVTEIALEIIRNRIDQFGVREPVIQRQGMDRILVQLPGITDRERALSLIGRTAKLEFQLVSDNPRFLERAAAGDVPTGFHLAEDPEDGSPLLLETEGSLSGSILASAEVTAGELGLPVVDFRLNKEGAKAFGRLTGSNIGRRLAIVLDGAVQSAPVIRDRITDSGQISGRFTREEAHDLAIVLRAGALPAPIVVEEERTVGPTLGKDSIRAGLLATGVGAGLIVLFMAGYYLLGGLVAIGALLLNLLMILGGMGYLQATLTLPGIAGMILTLGMAVDANVLIYERIREELRAGRPLSLAIDAGYDKAFTAILDSNVTTLIAAIFLYWFGTGPIRGFATTLGLGLMASMFTAIVVTRVVFDILLGLGVLKRLAMLQFIGQTKFDFIGMRKICYVLSAVLVLIGGAAFVMRGDERYGIDFTGGLLQEYRFNRPLSADALRSTLSKVGLGDAVLQQYGEPTEWLIRTADDTPQERDDTAVRTREAVYADYADAAPERVRLEQVGPSVGALLRQKAWLAIAWSMLGILVYVAIRFRHWDFGTSGVVALIHDVVIAAGALCLLGRQIDMTVIAALLTIAGFSINDTIVIYDRVRENLRLHRKLDMAAVINLSVNETLSRTLLTSLTVICAVGALLLFGGEVLRDFSICLLVGFFSGVYSTVAIATALVVTWRKLFQPRPA
ncbi:MAG: protein translocase subunit SecDF [Candidatus Omnitrophica bacterium CG11_big_fil_rev_8_21_14_0_20_63_9]|nr:MAG: protein translocase subunit SecDF [Candidatus Omnitrophica bacterium CG11_big_fil_rev_8_21_14_0_20_63_9]